MHPPVTNTRVAALADVSGMLLSLRPARLAAHEESARFSGTMIDPPILHHAHIENEQRLNFFVMRGLRDGTGRKRTGCEGELELAYSSKDFRYGFDVSAPFSSVPDPNGDGRETGIGDIEMRPLRYSLVMKPDFVLSTATAVGVPTGSESRGLGRGNTSVSQLLFADKAVVNWSAMVNLGLGGNVAGEKESSFEYGDGFSCSFIRGVKFGDLAPSRPEQKWVLQSSVKFAGERILQGDEAGVHKHVAHSRADALAYAHRLAIALGRVHSHFRPARGRSDVPHSNRQSPELGRAVRQEALKSVRQNNDQPKKPVKNPLRKVFALFAPKTGGPPTPAAESSSACCSGSRTSQTQPEDKGNAPAASSDSCGRGPDGGLRLSDDTGRGVETNEIQP